MNCSGNATRLFGVRSNGSKQVVDPTKLAEGHSSWLNKEEWFNLASHDILMASFNISVMKGPITIDHVNEMAHITCKDHCGYSREREEKCESTSFTKSLKFLLDTKTLCDFYILNRQQRFWCHKNVLRWRSPVFNEMFSTRWGSTTNSTEWNSVSAKSVQTFLNLVYGQNLDRSLTKTVLFEVKELAHKYLVKVRCPVQLYQPLVRKHDGAFHTTVAMAEKARSFGFDILQMVTGSLNPGSLNLGSLNPG